MVSCLSRLRGVKRVYNTFNHYDTLRDASNFTFALDSSLSKPRRAIGLWLRIINFSILEISNTYDEREHKSSVSCSHFYVDVWGFNGCCRLGTP